MSQSMSLLSLRSSSTCLGPLLGVDLVMWVRQAWSSRGAWWSRWPCRPWFSLWSHWPNYARETCLTLNPGRPCESCNSIFTWEARVTFLAFLTTWPWHTKRPFRSFDPHCPSVATGTWFTWVTFGPSRAFLPDRSTDSYCPLVPFGPSQSHRPFWTSLTTIPLGSWWSRSTC